MTFELLAPRVVGRRLLRTPEPREVDFGALRLGPAVLLPLDVGLGAKQPRSLLADVFGLHERANVEPHPIVEIRLPPQWLLLEWLPADKDVVGRLALEDLGELRLERLGRPQTLRRTGFVSLGVLLLLANPVS